MFYSQFILAKKGPLGTIWIAAHLERKLRKNQVADTDIGVSVDSILFPEVPIALRLSSHLLLGVVRIYSRKVNYLFDDCSEALLKVKQAFCSAAVDLPPEESKAPYHSITLPETFDLDDFELPDSDIIQGNYVDHHVSAREQITLQDPMDGIVFSTSQFGLDERFGDGDACQIGLDLEEEMLLDHGADAGHRGSLDLSSIPESSVEPSSPFEGAKKDVELYESRAAADVNSLNIQVPSTPGLAEEPNFQSALDAQINDDHMDEDQKSTEFLAKEVFGEASGEQEAYSRDSDTGLPPAKENDQLHQHWEAEKAVSQDSLPLVHYQLSLANGTPPSHGLEEMRNVENGVSVGDQRTASVFQSNDVDKPTSSEVDNSSAEAGDLSTIYVNGNLQDGTPLPQPVHSGTHEGMSSDAAPVIPACNSHNESAHSSLLSASTCILQACNVHLDDANIRPENIVSSPNHPSEKEVSPDMSVASTVVQEPTQGTTMSDQIRDAACFSITGAEHSNLDGHVDSLMSSDSLSRKDSVAVTDLASPEQLLCAADAGRSNELLVDSTPAKEILEEGDEDSTVNIISGKKRSFTESAVTFQSITSFESSAAAQSKKSVESIPDDDDLLSSILAGRRSNVLKLKPTPVQDVESTKRRRVTPRTTPYKRKVLMDESMVLHGDTIRQQLTSTEDIRRLRKKAPCTCLEIWRLQKQYLEDEIFTDPLLSGISAELNSLHSQPFDLSEIRALIDKTNGAVFPAPDELASCTKPGDKENGPGKDHLGSDTRDLMGEQYDKESAIQQSGKGSLSSDHSSLQHEKILLDNEHGDGNSQQDALQTNIATENEGRSIPAGDAVNLSVSSGDKFSSISPVSLENGMLMNDAILSASLTKIKDTDDSACNNVDPMLHSTDQELDSRTANTAYATVVNEGLESSLSGQSKKNELERSSMEVQFTEEMEGFDSLDRRIGTDLDKLSRPDDASAFAAMTLEGRVLAASDQASSVSMADKHVPDSKDILGSNQQCEDGVFDRQDVNSVFDTSMLDGYLDQELLEPTTDSSHTVIEDHAGFDNKFDQATDFLNFDDEDDIDDDGDNYAPNAEETGLQENIGWSSRTRAVANYLQVLFHKEAQQGRRAIHLDNLLAGKSRKEASRMFFETLVLKTRDYIHVEQEEPFCDISIKPRHQLMKSVF